jgi:hypothetical protein
LRSSFEEAVRGDGTDYLGKGERRRSKRKRRKKTVRYGCGRGSRELYSSAPRREILVVVGELKV